MSIEIQDTNIGNGIELITGFDLKAQQPIDSRLTVSTYKGLAALVEGNVAYLGMQVYVTEENATYELLDEGWARLVGRTTPEGGEIFGDYRSNAAYSPYSTAAGISTDRKSKKYTYAGAKSFKVLSVTNGTGENGNPESGIVVRGRVPESFIGQMLSYDGQSHFSNCLECLGMQHESVNGEEQTKVFVDRSKLPLDTNGNIPELTVDGDKVNNKTGKEGADGIPDNPSANEEDLVENWLWCATLPEEGEVNEFSRGACAHGEDVVAIGRGAHATGRETKAIGHYSHAEGRQTEARYAAHAEGQGTKATGQRAHAEGANTRATGLNAHAEGEGGEVISNSGIFSESSGRASHTEGIHAIASGRASHAEGETTKASGRAAHSEGWGTKAAGDAQHVQGKYNIEDNDNTYAHIVGNGENDSKRSNIHTLDWDGNAWYAGNIKAEGNVEIAGGVAAGCITAPAAVIDRLSAPGGLTIESDRVYTPAASLIVGTDTDEEIGNTTGIFSKKDIVTKGDAIIGNNLTVAGEVDIGQMTVQGEVEVKGNLVNVAGDISIQGGRIQTEGNRSLRVADTITADNITVNDTIRATVDVYANSGDKEHKLTDKANLKDVYTREDANDTFSRLTQTKGMVDGYVRAGLNGSTPITAYVATAEGYRTKAQGRWAHAEGYATQAGLTYNETSAAHAEGYYTAATGASSHAEGLSNKPYNGNGNYSYYDATSKTNIEIYDSENHPIPHGKTKEEILENRLKVFELSDKKYYPEEQIDDSLFSVAFGLGSHVEGRGCLALGSESHAEGKFTTCTGAYAHSEGYRTQALDESHAEGYKTYAQSESHAEGYETETYNYGSHAEGQGTTAGQIVKDNKYTGRYAHAEGSASKATGTSSHAEGASTEARATGSHAEGVGTIAQQSYQHVEGKYNQIDTDKKYLHIIGMGTSEKIDNTNVITRDNAFTVSVTGEIASKAQMATTGSDYAEFFEWMDGNPNSEDRIARVVTLVGDKITFAGPGDNILGIISGTVAVLGDNPEWNWKDKYITDKFGRIIYDQKEEFVTELDPETGEEVQISLGFFPYPRINPDYDPTQTYISREERPEWDKVGMLGKLYALDDGTCIPGTYATAGINGVLTYSSTPTNIYVMKRTAEDVVWVLFK